MFESIKNKALIASVAMVSLVATMPASAALTAEETAVYTAATGLVTDHAAAALTLLIGVITAFVGFSLLKKFVNKAI